MTEDLDVLLFYGYPAEQWVHLRTSNPIESTFESAQSRWRAVNAPHLALVRAGAVFEKGKLLERNDRNQVCLDYRSIGLRSHLLRAAVIVAVS